MSEETSIVDGNGSAARVAFDLAMKIVSWNVGVNPVLKTQEGFLDLYAECHKAARGHRD